MLWFTGGSSKLAAYFLFDDQENLTTYGLFYESTAIINVTPHPELGKISADDLVGECQICLIDIAAKESAALSCGHIICFPCAEAYISKQINLGKTSTMQLKCPGTDCDKFYNSYHVYAAAGFLKDSPLFIKYLEFNVTRAFESSPFIRYCSNKTCNKMIIAEPRKRRVVCSKCTQQTCSKCKKKYHKLPLCRRRENGSVLTWRMRWYYLFHGTRPCPNCRFLIEKTKGCDHMTCLKCSHEFCWRCSKPYTSDHFNNPLNCTGGRGISVEIWGPLYPLRVGFELGKDVTIITAVWMSVFFVAPYLVYRNWDEIGDFFEEKKDAVAYFWRRKIMRRDSRSFVHYNVPQSKGNVAELSYSSLF